MIDTLLYRYFAPGAKIPVNQVNEFINYNNGATTIKIPIVAIQQPGGPILGYTASSPFCVDCTVRGSNKQPLFWK